MLYKKCIVCDKSFGYYPYRENVVKFCSRKCKGIWMEGKKTWNKGISNKVRLKCKICKKVFYRNPSRKAIFCSPKCQAIGRTGIKRPDVRKRMLGNTHTLGYKHSEINKKKISDAGRKRGTNKMLNYPEREQIRKSFEYSLWRKAVYERDNFTCQKYGLSRKGLEAHHINNFAEFPELRLAIDNGITLSKYAHREFHKEYGYRHNTKEQLSEFLKS